MNMWTLMIRIILFFQLSGFLSGYKGIRKFLKAVSMSMYGFAYPPYFGNARRNEIMKRFVTSKVINKINDNAFCLPCFK